MFTCGKIITLSLFLILRVSYAGDVYTASACDYGDGLTSHNGLNVQAYSYPYGDRNRYASYPYLASEYTTESYIGEASGVTEPDFSMQNAVGTVYKNLYGLNIPISNVVLSYTGYFKAPETGVYTFKLTAIDDSAMIWLGSGLSCCNIGSITGSGDDALVISTKAYQGNTQTKSGYVYLQAGEWYPFRLTYTNIMTDAQLSFTIITPEGTTISDLSNYMFQLENPAGICNTKTVSLPDITSEATGTIDTTVTTVVSTSNKGGASYSQTEIIVYHAPSTTTTYWTGSSTSTYTTATQVTATNGATLTSNIVVVDIPSPSTTTELWTGSSTSTHTTASFNGDETTTIVVVDIPSPSTTTELWTGSSTVTHTSASFNGDETTTIVVVDIPSPSTTTELWTGSSTVTYTSASKISDSDESTTIVVVDIPSPSTTTELWTGSSTSTHTTASFNGDETTTIVVVDIPYSTSSDVSHFTNSSQILPSGINNSIYSPSSTLTGSTSSVDPNPTSFINPSYPEHPEYPASTSSALSTTTEYWDSSYTSTFTTASFNGVNSTTVVIIDIPSTISISPISSYTSDTPSLNSSDPISSTYANSTSSSSISSSGSQDTLTSTKEDPTITSLSTTTESWTGLSTTTYTTTSNNGNLTSTFVVIDIPSTTTTGSALTNPNRITSGNSGPTISHSSTTVYGSSSVDPIPTLSDLNSTTSNYLTSSDPAFISPSTTTEFWTGLSTTTYTTASNNGNITSTLVVVDIPSTSEAESSTANSDSSNTSSDSVSGMPSSFTTTECWTESFISTHTTTSANGNSNVVVVVVDVPSTSALTSNTLTATTSASNLPNDPTTDSITSTATTAHDAASSTKASDPTDPAVPALSESSIISDPVTSSDMYPLSTYSNLPEHTVSTTRLLNPSAPTESSSQIGDSGNYITGSSVGDASIATNSNGISSSATMTSNSNMATAIVNNDPMNHSSKSQPKALSTLSSSLGIYSPTSSATQISVFEGSGSHKYGGISILGAFIIAIAL